MREWRGTRTMSSNVRASDSPAAICAAAPNRSVIENYPFSFCRSWLPSHGPEALGPGPGLRAGTLLFFLAPPAVAGVVAPDLRLVATDRLDRGVVAAGAGRLRRPGR